MPSRRRRHVNIASSLHREYADLKQEYEEDVTIEQTQERSTQRRRTSAHASDEDDYAGDSSKDATQDGGLDDKVKKVVRLALACEYQRRPIRRTDIGDKIPGTHGRHFRIVWAQAQLHLRSVFGMEMVELPNREKVTLQQRRNAQKAPSQSKSVVSWVLMSVLPPEFRDPAILQPPAAPSSSDESKYTAIYTLLVSLIYLSGGTLPDAKMERSLRRLQMEDRTPIAEYEKTEKLLKRMEKEGYILKIKENTGTGEDDVYWIVGPRGKVEVGENGVRGLTSSVFGNMETETEQDELDRKIARSIGMNERHEIKAPDALPAGAKRGRKRYDEEDDHIRYDDEGDDADEDDD